MSVFVFIVVAVDVPVVVFVVAVVDVVVVGKVDDDCVVEDGSAMLLLLCVSMHQLSR